VTLSSRLKSLYSIYCKVLLLYTEKSSVLFISACLICHDLTLNKLCWSFEFNQIIFLLEEIIIFSLIKLVFLYQLYSV
jgi:hypothetical protein